MMMILLLLMGELLVDVAACVHTVYKWLCKLLFKFENHPIMKTKIKRIAPDLMIPSQSKYIQISLLGCCGLLASKVSTRFSYSALRVEFLFIISGQIGTLTLF